MLAEAEGLPLYLPLVGLGQIVYFIQYEPLQPEVHCENQQGAEVREETLPSQQWRDQSLVVDRLVDWERRLPTRTARRLRTRG